MKIKVKDTFFVFDLDDTLYKEQDYVLSGFSEISKQITSLFSVNLDERILKWWGHGDDVFDKICSELGMSASSSLKESLLWTYRLHNPKIKLSDEVRGVINFISSHSSGVAILTDGRSVTQRKKIITLELNHFPLYISDDFNSEKPNPLRFEKIMNDCQAKNYVYIGDNPKKDFKAPNELGWYTIGIRGDGSNIHSQSITNLDQCFLPKQWVNSFSDLAEIFNLDFRKN